MCLVSCIWMQHVKVDAAVFFGLVILKLSGISKVFLVLYLYMNETPYNDR